MQILLIAIQCVALLILAFMPFGFDHPSLAGLEFDDFLACAAVDVVALLAGLAVAIAGKRWWVAGIQVSGFASLRPQQYVEFVSRRGVTRLQ